MQNFDLRKITVAVPQAANPDNITLTASAEFIAPDVVAVLFISDVNLLVQDGTAILSVNDGVNTLPLESPRGYNVRANQIVTRAERKHGGIRENTTVPIKVAVATDPARLVCLTPLRANRLNRPATTAGTATGTGINLD